MLYWFLVASVVAAIVGALGVGMSATAVGITPVLAALIGSFNRNSKHPEARNAAIGVRGIWKARPLRANAYFFWKTSS